MKFYSFTTLLDNDVALSEVQQISASRLLGNATGSTANVSQISLGAGLEFSGSTLRVSGGGNTYTISLPFSKGGGNVNGTITVPENAILLNCWIKIEEELSTTGAPFTIRLDGSSPLVLGTQGTDFGEMVGSIAIINLLGSVATTDFESAYKITSSNSGVLQANHSGSGYGSGIIYLQYSTELS